MGAACRSSFFRILRIRRLGTASMLRPVPAASINPTAELCLAGRPRSRHLLGSLVLGLSHAVTSGNSFDAGCLTFSQDHRSHQEPRPGAVGVLETEVPRLACLRPTAWLCERARTAHLHQQALKILARGQASQGGRCKTPSGAVSPGWLARGGEIKARQTSRGSRDVSHDDRDQAGASAHSVLVSSLVLRRQAQARSPEASGKGFHIGATRPRPAGR